MNKIRTSKDVQLEIAAEASVWDVVETLRAMLNVQKRHRSLSAICIEAGIPPATASNILRGKNQPSLYTAEKLLNAMGYRLEVRKIWE